MTMACDDEDTLVGGCAGSLGARGVDTHLMGEGDPDLAATRFPARQTLLEHADARRRGTVGVVALRV